VVRSATLCCTRDSIIFTPNTKVIAISAVVTDIECNNIHIAISILFQSCIQQTVLREYTFNATPVCDHADCNNYRNLNVDNCDFTCGCGHAGSKSCPSC
ncbi:MAG: hypothetical protein RR332_02810, partial [Clostridiales bacterium]